MAIKLFQDRVLMMSIQWIKRFIVNEAQRTTFEWKQIFAGSLDKQTLIELDTHENYPVLDMIQS
jgi:hypothetical protein